MSCFASIFRRPCLPLHSAQSAPPVWAHVHSTHGSHLAVTCPPPSIALEALECFCGLRGRKETASIRLQSVAAFIVAGGFCYKRGQPETCRLGSILARHRRKQLLCHHVISAPQCRIRPSVSATDQIRTNTGRYPSNLVSNILLLLSIVYSINWLSGLPIP